MDKKFEVFKVEAYEYRDELGIKRKESVKGATTTLTLTERTETAPIFYATNKVPIAEDADGNEFVRQELKCFGRCSTVWRCRDTNQYWYETYAGTLGVKQ